MRGGMQNSPKMENETVDLQFLTDQKKTKSITTNI